MDILFSRIKEQGEQHREILAVIIDKGQKIHYDETSGKYQWKELTKDAMYTYMLEMVINVWQWKLFWRGFMVNRLHLTWWRLLQVLHEEKHYENCEAHIFEEASAQFVD